MDWLSKTRPWVLIGIPFVVLHLSSDTAMVITAVIASTLGDPPERTATARPTKGAVIMDQPITGARRAIGFLGWLRVQRLERA